MNFIKPTYYLEYTTESEPNVFKYKKINTSNPSEVNYEDGMYFFRILETLNLNVDGKDYYIITKKDDDGTAFGELDTPNNILLRMAEGEEFQDVTAEDIRNWINKKCTFYISGLKNIYVIKSFKNYVPAIKTDNQYMSEEINLHNTDFIGAEIIWYVEYKKNNDETLYYSPTFCSDKKIRDLYDVEIYRFVKVARFTLNNHEYNIVFYKESQLYEFTQKAQRDEVDIAIDEAVKILYGVQNEEVFNGYTRIYPFNTEDSASVFENHFQNIANQDVLTVTGSGDASLDLFLRGAKSVTCFDINGLAKYYAKLKFYAVKSGLSYNDYINYFSGKRIGDFILPIEIYNKFSQIMDISTKRFWDAIYNYLEVNNKKISNNKHSILYSIIDFFGSANKSLGNPQSYLTSDNYVKLQTILQSKTEIAINFIDASLFDLPKFLNDKKFNYIYLSNIIDFTSLFIEKEEIQERMEIFRDFIIYVLSIHANENGLIDVGFLSSHWRNGNDQLSVAEYSKIFLETANFQIQDLSPFNKKDFIIIFKKKMLKYSAITNNWVL